jgi:hypothetical protein
VLNVRTSALVAPSRAKRMPATTVSLRVEPRAARVGTSTVESTSKRQLTEEARLENSPWGGRGFDANAVTCARPVVIFTLGGGRGGILGLRLSTLPTPRG